MNFFINAPSISLVLASQSPRRKELLEELGIAFKVIPSGASEDTDEIDPERRVLELSLMKAKVVSERCSESFIISADTVVAHQNKIFEKPKDDADAVRMLKTLSGDKHKVYGGVCILKPGGETIDHFVSVTTVIFNAIDDELVKAYINTGEHRDKAGAYGIQGFAKVFVNEIQGSYSNVVGLDIAMLLKSLRAHQIVALQE